MTESPLAGVQLHLANNLDTVLQCREWLSEQRDGPIAFDCESTGLSPTSDRLRLLQIGDLNHGWAFPAEWAGAAVEMLLGYDDDLVGHNVQFDIRFIKFSLGQQIPYHRCHDTMFIAALADSQRPKGLKPLSARLIDRNATAGEQILKDGMKANGWTWATVPSDYSPWWAYGALDPVLTAHLWRLTAADVIRDAPEAYDLERAVSPLLANMMDTGLLISPEYVAEKLAKLREYITNVRSWLSDNYGINSLMSARQLHAALLATGVEITATTPTGLPSVDKDALEAVSISEDAPQAARDLASTVLKARHSEKIAGTYLDGFINIADSDSIIHCSINQLAAKTGRMSVSQPSLQNLPRDERLVRGCFVPRPGNVFISCDYSAIEMRLAAAMSDDPGLIKAFYEADHGGRDLYATIASDLYGEHIEKADKRRQLTKNFSYAKLYGSGVPKMASMVGMKVSQVRPIYDMFSARFPGLDQLSSDIQRTAREEINAGKEPATFTSTGRRLIGDRSRLYSLTNYRIQGEAAEVLKRGICNMAASGFTDAMRLPIHDEILSEVPAGDAEEACRLIEEAMSDNDRYSVPLRAEAKILPERWSK